MVIQFKTSFTPPKTPIVSREGPHASWGGVNLFSIIAFVTFFLTGALAAGVFFYKSYLVRAIVTMDASLAEAKKSFEPEFIEEAARLHARIAAGKELLNQHRALSPLFDILEKKTLENVRFQDLHFTAEQEKDILLSMTGEARSFNAVALQSDVFGTEPSFTNPVFSNFNLNDSGDVVFDFSTTVDVELLRYREMVLGDRESDNKEGVVPLEAPAPSRETPSSP